MTAADPLAVADAADVPTLSTGINVIAATVKDVKVTIPLDPAAGIQLDDGSRG
ncbi:hypothetical protein AB4Z18_11370 [Leifsonia sp. 2TAF2]|uniref:hypothetical protein n=1 Tax=Leifsonia sp. 2TAF2 TaxID=3233009 RepID=UPI003F99134C